MSSFKQDVIKGLSADVKFLSSRYFYDAIGDRIFQEIMAMPSYYLTRAEGEIFNLRKKEIFQALNFKDNFNLVELGAGDGQKTKVLLRSFLQEKARFQYLPIDISPHVLAELEASLAKEIPDLKVKTMANEYFEALEKLKNLSSEPKLVLFLGSNIGNFPKGKAEAFMSNLGDKLAQGDKVLMGVDLKKDPAKILAAYSDKTGITAGFNLNILDRINKELGANIAVENFDHYASYNPQNGECRSYLICRKAQEIKLKDHPESFYLDEYACIHTEISKKYSPAELEALADETGFNVVQKFYDSQKQFCDILIEKR